jgi:hypothetical protein
MSGPPFDQYSAIIYFSAGAETVGLTSDRYESLEFVIKLHESVLNVRA